MRFRLWFGFVLSIFGILLTCWNLSFNAIALPLKATFNLTQSQLELVSSLGSIGGIFCIVQPVLTAKFGYTTIYTSTGIMAPVCGSLLYLAVRQKSFFSQWVWMIAGFQFLAGLCTSFFYMFLINIGIDNFPKEHTGKLIGLYTGTGAVGKLVYASSLELLFESDLEDFFLTISIVWALVFGACVFFHRRRDITDPDLVPEVELEEPLEKQETVEHEDNETVPVRVMFRSPHFHLIFWSFAFMNGSIMAYMNNLTSIGASVGMEEPTYLVYTLSVTLLVCRVLSGLLFDKLTTPVSRFVLMFLCHLTFTVAMIILMVQFTSHVLYVVTVLVGVGMLAAFSLPIIMLVTRFGRKNYGIIYGCISICAPLMLLPYQFVVGFIYDLEAIHQNSDHFCAGESCFNITIIVFLISGVIASILHIINFCLERKLEN